MVVSRSRCRSAPVREDYPDLCESFLRSLRAENKSAHTLDAYRQATRQFGDFLRAEGLPLCAADITRAHVEAFVSHLLETKSSSTAGTRYRGLQQFFRWLTEEGIVPDSPMRHMEPPKEPEKASPGVLTEEHLKRLLRACEGKEFADRRDLALISLLMDTGMRRAECAKLTLADLDLDANTAHVMGKGRRTRVCPFGERTARDLDRYLRERAKRTYLNSGWASMAR